MRVPAWLDELDLHAGPPEASMGTRVLDERRWLTIDDDWSFQRDAARRLLTGRRADVLASPPPGAARDAADELGSRLDRWLATYGAEVVDDGHLAERDPLAAARARVAEDLCLLLRGEHGWRLVAGAVCFPSYWRLREKVGHPLADVHGPVPGYHGPLAGRVDAFLDRLHPGRGVWRRNWSIHADARLFVARHADTANPAPGDRWLRSEYQTLVRLESAAAVVFTIRTQHVGVERLAGCPELCRALAAALRGWTPAQRAYKGAAVDDALLRWLDDQDSA